MAGSRSQGLSDGAESCAEALVSRSGGSLPYGSGRDFYVGYTQTCLIETAFRMALVRQ